MNLLYTDFSTSSFSLLLTSMIFRPGSWKNPGLRPMTLIDIVCFSPCSIFNRVSDGPHTIKPSEGSIVFFKSMSSGCKLVMWNFRVKNSLSFASSGASTATIALSFSNLNRSRGIFSSLTTPALKKLYKSSFLINFLGHF